ncbi:hypothetical protein CL614_02370 [archaeon]|nr:hypothetical protein [archaeon]|tara:strand:+ start:2742 stop:3341 length:600 start_codon:yes stop_codon:yes gene_type:complete
MNYKEHTIISYDKHAELFVDKFKGLLDIVRRDEFPKFIDLIPGKKILDLGSGGGDHAQYFSTKGLDVTCIDLSSKMIDLCKAKGLKSFVMDIEDLKFKNESFDGIWAVTSLLHVEKHNLPRVIVKLHDILRNNGILYVCVKEGTGEKIIPDKKDKTGRFFTFFSKDELLELFEDRFELLEFGKTPVGKTIFLEAFFKKS